MNSGVQHKLLNHEVTPPPGVWDKIAAELDESELHHSFPSKLYEAEVIAPTGVWNNIQAALNEDHEVVVPKRRAIAPWLRYAAAAVVIGLIAWGGLSILNNKKSAAPVASDKTIQDPKTNIDIAVTPTNPGTVIINQAPSPDKTDEARNDAALEASKKTFAKLDIPVNSHRLKNIASSYSFASTVETGPADNYISERDPADLSDRYIVLMTPDGHFVRMAKKLSNMVCCVSGEEQDKECVDQMSRWKEKMACSPTGHSTGSFLDILNLIKSLDDK